MLAAARSTRAAALFTAVHASSNKTAYIHNMLFYQANIEEAHVLFVVSGGFSPWNSSISFPGALRTPPWRGNFHVSCWG